MAQMPVMLRGKRENFPCGRVRQSQHWNVLIPHLSFSGPVFVPPLLRVQLFGLQRAWQRCIKASHRADQHSGTQRTCRVQPGVAAHADSFPIQGNQRS